MTESIVEQAALTWLEKIGWQVMPDSDVPLDQAGGENSTP